MSTHQRRSRLIFWLLMAVGSVGILPGLLRSAEAQPFFVATPDTLLRIEATGTVQISSIRRRSALTPVLSLMWG